MHGLGMVGKVGHKRRLHKMPVIPFAGRPDMPRVARIRSTYLIVPTNFDFCLLGVGWEYVCTSTRVDSKRPDRQGRLLIGHASELTSRLKARINPVVG